ncbi:hypothetical protein CR513_37829, partial [Mucuna pruriens]
MLYRWVKFCEKSRYKARTVSNQNSKDVPHKRLEEGVLCHPSEGKLGNAWKHFDKLYPEFASKPQNVRLGLCVDGFTPFSQSTTPYSCWPVIVTPYNLPLELCMMTPYMFLTLIIPGPHNLKGKIDVFLQPLIDELQQLWNDGVITYDASKKKNFRLRAALMWTVNDFPMYRMLFRSTAENFACVICIKKSKSFTLKYDKKMSWFDSHRQLLPHSHAFRRNKDAFYKNRMVSDIFKTNEVGICNVPSRDKSHNWMKRNIF